MIVVELGTQNIRRRWFLRYVRVPRRKQRWHGASMPRICINLGFSCRGGDVFLFRGWTVVEHWRDVFRSCWWIPHFNSLFIDAVDESKRAVISFDAVRVRTDMSIHACLASTSRSSITWATTDSSNENIKLLGI